ncbi:MAG: glycosyl transferase family 2 [Herminiimonas sp.]|nr:glycosyl transferase family 2 [Herminiimonas sp.]
MNAPFFSIVIPIYNRAWSLRRAVLSAVTFANGQVPIEVVLVDDGSEDDSLAIARSFPSDYARNPLISFQVIAHTINRGVCAAKNTGALASHGDWIVFLDSDDELIEECASEVFRILHDSGTLPLQFFGSVGEHEPYALSINRAETRDLNTLLIKGTDGEALPVIKREVFVRYLYDEDMPGYESLCYLRIVKDYSGAMVNSLTARRYYTGHEDRLSSKSGMTRRHRALAKGHWRLLTEHWASMSPLALAKQGSRYVKASILSYIK